MSDNFKVGCFTYITVRDICRHIDTYYEGRHLGRLTVDRVLVKIIWDQDVCDFLHHVQSDDDEDIMLVYLSQEGPLYLDDSRQAMAM